MVKKLQLLDVPRYIPMPVYDKTREEVRKRYMADDNVIEAMEYGTIPYPGISDMDTIILVKPGSATELPKLKSFTPDEQYVICHKHFVMSADLWSKVKLLDPWMFQATPLLHKKEGFSVPESDFNEEGHYAMTFYRMIDGIVAFLHLIGQTEAQGGLRIREFLDSVVIIKYYYRELERIGIATQDEDDNVAFFVELREKWFEFTPEERQQKTEDTFRRFRESLAKIIPRIEEWFSKKSTYVQTNPRYKPATHFQRKLLRKYPNSIILDTGNSIHVYQKDRTETEIIHQTFYPVFTKLYAGIYEKNIYLLPLHLSAIQNGYLNGNGPISQSYQKGFCTDMDTIPVYEHPTVEGRVLLTDTNAEHVKNIHGGKQPFPLYGYEVPQENVTYSKHMRQQYDKIMQYISRNPVGRLLQKSGCHISL